MTCSKGWPVLTGPYRIVRSEPAQRIWDLREGWWAEKLGFQELPQVERLIYLTYMEEHKRVQNLIANNIDTCLELRPANMVSLLERNRNITTWTGREPPYSYITWWPISLGFNGLEAPWSDPEMRRAVNYAIDRDQLVAIGWQNSGAWTLLPLPDLPQMHRYFTLAEDLVTEHQVGVFDLEKSAEILTRKGYEHNGVFWEKDGQRAEHGHRHLLSLSGSDAGAHRPAQKGRHRRLLPHDLGFYHAPAPGHGPRVPNRQL